MSDFCQTNFLIKSIVMRIMRKEDSKNILFSKNVCCVLIFKWKNDRDLPTRNFRYSAISKRLIVSRWMIFPFCRRFPIACSFHYGRTHTNVASSEYQLPNSRIAFFSRIRPLYSFRLSILHYFKCSVVHTIFLTPKKYTISICNNIQNSIHLPFV